MEKNNNIHNVTIKFTKEEFENAIDKAFDKKKNDIKMDGFRKGKVPKDIYFKKVGKESLYMEAIDTLLPTAYDKAIKENNYEPIIDPKVDRRCRIRICHYNNARSRNKKIQRLKNK